MPDDMTKLTRDEWLRHARRLITEGKSQISQGEAMREEYERLAHAWDCHPDLNHGLVQDHIANWPMALIMEQHPDWTVEQVISATKDAVAEAARLRAEGEREMAHADELERFLEWRKSKAG